MGIHSLESTNGQSAICAGDSGGVLFRDGLAVGAARMASNCSKYVEDPTWAGANITAYAFHQDWIIEQMNFLAYATEVSYAGADVLTKTVQVQNLTAGDALLTPTLMDDTGYFDADLGACNVLLASGESCEISVTIDGTASSDTASAYIELSSGEQIALSLNPVAETPEEPETPSEGGSSGGSSGPFMLAALGAMFWLRRRSK